MPHERIRVGCGTVKEKRKTQFFCQSCGYQSSKWMGKCPNCHEWNSLVEEEVVKGGGNTFSGIGGDGEVPFEARVAGEADLHVHAGDESELRRDLEAEGAHRLALLEDPEDSGWVRLRGDVQRGSSGFSGGLLKSVLAPIHCR